MNAITFRAWDTKKKEMVYDGSIDKEDNGDGVIEGTELNISFSGDIYGYSQSDGGKDGLWEHDVRIAEGRLTLMWSVGLSDKNGKPAFLNDILRNTLTNLRAVVKNGEYRGRTGSGFGLFLERLDSEPYIPMPCDLMEWEIIGNTYDNPELMEKKS
jgi:hypothetical protein